ncbi:MAG: chloride channel protein, partial [Saprospiraceae bacterium]|nr:chloride channel protein [Saprospiraceae bacterium]
MSFNKVKDKFLTESTSFVLVIVGLLILVTSLVLFIFKTSSLSVGAPIDSGIFDHFGSLIGGLVGSIWALAGFILFYVALTEQKKSTEASIDALNLQKEELKLQRTELKMQRDELKDTRKEFEIERITTLIFKQLDRIDTIINSVNV